MIISLCGKSGSGKSTLALELKKIYKSNIMHVDIDKIAHNILLKECVKSKLVENFGEIILIDNKVDRKVLGKIVFNSKDKMNILSEITWKYMNIEIDEIIENNKNKIIILDYILVYKTDYFKNSDLRILLDVPYEIRKERLTIKSQ